MNPTDSLACHHAPPTLSVSPRPDHPLTLTRSKSVSILLKPVPENSSPDRPAGLATCVPTVRGTDHSNLSISEFSCWQAQAKNMFFPTLSHADFQRQHVSLHLPETCLWADSATKHMEASSHSFFGLNIQALLARQMKRRTDFNTFEKKEKEEALFSKQMWSQKQQTSSGNSLKPSDLQDTTDAKSGWDIKGKPEQLRICQQLLYVKTLQENLQQKYSQLFWGLPSLHSESLVATLLVSSSSSPLESPFVLFNGICNVSAVKMWDQEFPPLPRAQPLPLPSVHPQPLPQTLPQSQHLPFTQVQPQAHLQSPLPILPASPSQIRNCGVSFQRPQNESDSHISTENQHLEWHVLQKQQESLRGVVPGFQKSQEAIFPRAPKPSSVSQSSHAYVPVSILPGHFHITSEPQEKLELHAPRRLIPHCCLHTCRNLEFLALREPQCKFTETSQQKGRHAHSQLSELHSQSSEDLAETELSLPGSFHGRIPTNRQLRKDMRRNLGYILEKSPEDSPQRVSECYLVKGLRAASETKSNCVWHSSIQSGNEFLNVSRKDIDQNEIKTILTLHLSKKFWQITEGRIPLGVCLSWLADDKPSAPPGSSHTNMKSRDSKNTIVGRVYHQITTLELSFLDPNTRQVLEAHIIRFRVSQRWGLPLKVLESIKFYKLRDAKTRPLPQFDFLSSATCISGVDSKAEVSKPLQGSSQSFQGNKVRTTNSVPILDHPLPATSSVGNEGRGALKPSHSDTDCELAEDVQTTEHGRQTLEPLPHSIKDEVNQSKTVLHKRCSPEVPTRQAGAGHEPSGENVGSSERVQTIQGQKTVEKKLEHFSMSAMNFREIFKAEELCALKSQSCDILTTSELRSSQMVSVNTSKVETTLTTECPSPKIPLLQDSKLPDVKKQLHNELKFQLKSRGNTQAQACHTDMSFTLDSLPSNSSLTQSQSISSGDMGASQVLHVHLEDNGDWQQPWVSKYVLCKCQHMNFPPAAKRVRPLRSKAGECGSEDSGAGTSKARQKRHPVEDTELEDTSLSLSQNEQLPPESYFRKKMRQFFQWLSSKRTITGQESPQQKAKFISTFAQHQDPAESAALLESCGPPEAHELMIAIGKILEEKLARRYEPEPSEFSQQKEELQAQVEPDKAHPSNYGALSDPQQGAWAGTKSCSQVSADQS
ncbi:spermatogenesis-associated protein 31D1-like [Diceros bicornis minor]|uniref:spermatogenesis-associated protein 31D1-like n=1 Tax=Diceros bicornis minor TaxID=77932 RepID=UPI0026EC7041|nr:spermatogenesis-associated protein 31D1-like [Diceros bicornis minor]